MEQPTLTQPAAPIADFLDRLHANSQCIVPGSLLWIRHPEKPGKWVVGVQVEEEKREDDQNN
jgi:hypothetical protein